MRGATEKRSVVLNEISLKEEFPELEPSIVSDVYHSCLHDCERARGVLWEMTGRKRLRPEDTVPVRGDHGMELEELSGDLFGAASPEASLAHCVSEDLAMGKGIAIAFKTKFGRVQELKNQRAVIGSGAFLRQGNRFIYYMITKAKYWNKPTLANVKKSLEWMRDHAVKSGVKVIAMPRIGCGLDGLKWPDVKNTIVEVFDGTTLKIQVFVL